MEIDGILYIAFGCYDNDYEKCLVYACQKSSVNVDTRELSFCALAALPLI
jgi:hypothetical protein